LDDQLKIERFLTKDILHQDITNRKKGSKGNSKQGGVTRGRKIHSKKATPVVQGKLLESNSQLIGAGMLRRF
jgi:hypothetical protein